MGNFITEFDKDYKVIKNIKSNKIDVGNMKWLIYEAKIYEEIIILLLIIFH